MVIALTALLRAGTGIEEQAIRAALQPHLCRCGTHMRILRAARSLTGADGAQ
jgi:aerobic-type carbon monoxide dehydrogenase small subunit (CoxS/CutS family)